MHVHSIFDIDLKRTSSGLEVVHYETIPEKRIISFDRDGLPCVRFTLRNREHDENIELVIFQDRVGEYFYRTNIYSGDSEEYPLILEKDEDEIRLIDDDDLYSDILEITVYEE